MVTTALVIVLVGYGVLCGLLFALQRSFVYPAPRDTHTSASMRRVTVNGATFFDWSDAGPGTPVVVHFHGNGEQVGDLGWLAELYREQGVSFAAVEYPGYPSAGGSPSEHALEQAAQAALTWLTPDLQIDKRRLILSGQSLGTGVAMKLAAKGWGTRLILLSPYTSLPDVAAGAFSMFPVRVLMLDRYDSLGLAPRVGLPALVIHGTVDEVIPFALGKRLSGALPGARFVPIEGAGHNDLWAHETTRTEVMRFVRGQ